MKIELSENVIDAIADAVAKKMKEPKTGHWIAKDGICHNQEEGRRCQ